MAAPTTPLPTAKAPGEDERSVLLGYLDYHRIVLARKAEGLSDDQARRAACPPSDLTLLGLVRHLTDIERIWFRHSLLDEPIPLRYSRTEDDEGDFRPPPDATIADALTTYWEEIEVSNHMLATAALDDVSHGDPDPGHSLRRILVHLIEEYARHCGHADLLRQAIDGTIED